MLLTFRIHTFFSALVIIGLVGFGLGIAATAPMIAHCAAKIPF